MLQYLCSRILSKCKNRPSSSTCGQTPQQERSMFTRSGLSLTQHSTLSFTCPTRVGYAHIVNSYRIGEKKKIILFTASANFIVEVLKNAARQIPASRLVAASWTEDPADTWRPVCRTGNGTGPRSPDLNRCESPVSPCFPHIRYSCIYKRRQTQNT